ncbi:MULTISPECIES: phosphotransferase family protein [unclassified Streptomyces]|uniref:phosphotransferase family protein n=1 Tax=unclassified Streptomyces TaxID=2593676 RepID=UPI000823A089|nr:Phosphotransferase enzyme family protein [Streptomyces sp. AmelKG-E11A]
MGGRPVPRPADLAGNRAGPLPAGDADRRTEWRPDGRLGEHPGFPRSAVLAALDGEDRAPAERVFTGTSHLNTVVAVPVPHGDGRTLVVVRRERGTVHRLERSFLSEHAVLRAIEESGAAVRAPRVLALGVSGPRDRFAAQAYEGPRDRFAAHACEGPRDRFAIHSYEGPRDGVRPPEHPVDGLLPHEADDLVDQLAALTGVGHERLDPTAGGVDFFAWLRGELVRLVRELPRPSRRLAREVGLPGGDRLAELLARREVRARPPVLLHGDLNPWNLVRGQGPDRGLTLIDWEMAVVGDPLYDLARHLHLTPTRPEIRRRMLARWAARLPARHTIGWERDLDVYRTIESVRSAYVDLDRLVTGAALDAPNVQRAVESWAMTLRAATAGLGLPLRSTTDPCLARAFPPAARGAAGRRPVGT